MNEGDAGIAVLVGLIPWVLLAIPMGIVINLLAKQKGRGSLATTIFAFVPFVNFYLMVYYVGATSRPNTDASSQS